MHELHNNSQTFATTRNVIFVNEASDVRIDWDHRT
jgi:hypothetical protein